MSEDALMELEALKAILGDDLTELLNDTFAVRILLSWMQVLIELQVKISVEDAPEPIVLQWSFVEKYPAADPPEFQVRILWHSFCLA